MPREHKSRREVLDAIKTLPSIADLLSGQEGHFDHEIDLEVVVYGRNYGGKKVGPYVRLLSYEPGEAIITEGDWGGNTFYFVVDDYVDVFINNQDKVAVKVAELKAGTQFGEMSILAGVPRNATVKAPPNRPASILEVQRPALRLLRKLPRFGDILDTTYRSHGRSNALDELKELARLTPEMMDALRNIAQFKVFSKSHVLFRENGAIDRLYIIKEGWLRRERDAKGQRGEDFSGRGYCFGIEGILRNEVWPYTATLMARSEILEISIGKLRGETRLRETLARALPAFAPLVLGERVNYEARVKEKYLAAQEKLIDTGLVDATNLLVMDMALCVRCGNCSLACHKIHGQSRLLRRGIHVTRLEAPRASAIQSVLAPAVCMHCQDPECLTGCPTGAIGRFGDGQIDISASTCIGCGDCATQCPYNAIAMVPRKPKQSVAEVGLASRLRDYLRLKSDPLPPAVEQTDDLVAVKCNLCTGTTLNPPGAKTQAYSCEENCPTGALARINPREYFTEVEQIEGLLLIDKTHAIGRNIHKSDPRRKLIHVAGVLSTILATGLVILGLSRHGLGEQLLGFLNMRWITGIVGLAGIAAVMTYPVRRRVYRKRKGPLRYWMLVHSYSGVIAGIVILLHGGTDSGGALTTALMIVYDVVIATGLFGIFCYLVVPRLLTRIEGTPLLIDDLNLRRVELQEEIARVAGSPSQPLSNLVRDRVVPRFVSLGYLLRQYLKREALDSMIEAARREFGNEAAGLIDEKERRRLLEAVEAAATLRRVDALIYLHRLLKLWLPPHVAATSLMLALMLVHIIQVLYYASW
jgi:Fe-S-cluster-containing dehydrogenase component/CRP-like cAMP-binding protein